MIEGQKGGAGHFNFLYSFSLLFSGRFLVIVDGVYTVLISLDRVVRNAHFTIEGVILQKYPPKKGSLRDHDDFPCSICLIVLFLFHVCCLIGRLSAIGARYV
jgi:hypothetical protein